MVIKYATVNTIKHNRQLENYQGMAMDPICINTKATLMRFTEKEITVVGWCRMHKFDRGLFYRVINNATLKTRTAIKGRKILEALRRDNLLVTDPGCGCNNG